LGFGIHYFFIMVSKTTVPETFKDAKFILVVKDQLDFHNEEPQNAGADEHKRWFTQFWWKRPAAIVAYDTREEAMEQGLITPHPYWWIVFDGDGNYQDGGF
tara:strand:- start:570 stop:872 length:303 start_codon:yes stop_codon:yes gene_type:complete